MPNRRPQANHGLTDIKRFFDQPPLQYLGLELAVCWIIDCLLAAAAGAALGVAADGSTTPATSSPNGSRSKVLSH